MEYYLILMLLGAIIDQCDGSKSVVKRVINGEPLIGRPSTYKSIRYYGAMASGHNWIWNHVVYWDFVKPTDVVCSGSLLTPGIFQTACHCLADYNLDDKGFLKPAQVRHYWEGKQIIYVGISVQAEFDDYKYIHTVKYYVHQKCAQLGDRGKGAKVLTYDYALVTLDATWIKRDDVPPTFPWIEIEFAPTYTSQVIRHFHHVAQAKELVCIVVGFGLHEQGAPQFSDVLRVGWMSLMQHRDCLSKWSYALVEPNSRMRPNRIQIQDRFNWVCTHDFPKQGGVSAGTGDSGGPLACDNRYIGLQSGGTYLLDLFGRRVDNVDSIHAIVFSLFENAVNHRNTFIHVVDKLDLYRTRRHITVDDDDNSIQSVLPHSLSR